MIRITAWATSRSRCGCQARTQDCSAVAARRAGKALQEPLVDHWAGWGSRSPFSLPPVCHNFRCPHPSHAVPCGRRGRGRRRRYRRAPVPAAGTGAGFQAKMEPAPAPSPYSEGT